MASVTILSDNGATSGSAGLKTSGGNDGVLLLQTTTSGGTPTTAITIDNTQTVTFTNQPTYTGGTANGVLYLNGSKAVTSGTALVFDGTNLGVGVTPSAWSGINAVQFNNGSLSWSTNRNYINSNAYWNGSNWLRTTTGAANQFVTSWYDNNFTWNYAASGASGATIGWTAGMLLDGNGNLGVGTSTPATRVHAVGNATYDPLRLESTMSGYARSWTLGPNVGINGMFAIRDSTAGDNRLNIDSLGTTGVGVAPSTWQTTRRALQIGYSGALWANTSSEAVAVTSNGYLNSGGTWTYINTGFSTSYSQGSGQHEWRVAASGTAGTTISFTQAMTLSASGYLGVGVTSPGCVVAAAGISNFGGTIAGAPLNTTNDTAGCVMLFKLGQSQGYQFSGTFAANSWTGNAMVVVNVIVDYVNDNVYYQVLSASTLNSGSSTKVTLQLVKCTYGGSSYLGLKKNGGGSGTIILNGCTQGNINYPFEVASGSYTVTSTVATLN